jgi:hypothetical protein
LFKSLPGRVLKNKHQVVSQGAVLDGGARRVFLWERLSASIIAAGKPLPQLRWFARIHVVPPKRNLILKVALTSFPAGY